MLASSQRSKWGGVAMLYCIKLALDPVLFFSYPCGVHLRDGISQLWLLQRRYQIRHGEVNISTYGFTVFYIHWFILFMPEVSDLSYELWAPPGSSVTCCCCCIRFASTSSHSEWMNSERMIDSEPKCASLGQNPHLTPGWLQQQHKKH